MEQLKENTLYISFHRPRNILGYMISLWTLGDYSHCEFVYNNRVYLANSGGIRESEFHFKENYDIYELDYHINPDDILDFFKEFEGVGYDYRGIIGSQFLWFLNSHNDKKFFCSEFCLNAIDYALQFSLTWKLKELRYKGYHKFSPNRLYKYLKDMELIGERIKVLPNGK